MFKTLTTIILTALVVLFGVQNFDHVPVYIFWGKALNIRLIFVVAIAGTGGYLIRHFVGLKREERLKRQFRMLSRNNFKGNSRKRTDEFDDVEI
ncbi:MAG TPA: hypothetical protein HPP41_00165 [Deltaproteobacteria bacterium]|nr:hypothetical protein [Deltaproteobacteria bacterium]